eukprot:767850-Hanusia_phi.AAC.2
MIRLNISMPMLVRKLSVARGGNFKLTAALYASSLLASCSGLLWSGYTCKRRADDNNLSYPPSHPSPRTDSPPLPSSSLSLSP